jgi:hypothetical protein
MPVAETEETLVAGADPRRLPAWANGLGEMRSAPPDGKSPRLDAIAAQAALGPLVRRLRGASEARFRYGLGSAVLLGASLVLIVLVALSEPPRSRPPKRGAKPRPPPTLFDKLAREPQAFVVPFAIPIGVYALFRLFVVLGLRIQIHKNGFVFARLGAIRAVRWDEIRTVRTWIYELIGNSAAGTYGYVKLDLTGGRTVSINEDIDDLEGVRSIIQQATFDGLFVPIVAAVAQGATVPFGPLAVRRDGLMKGSDFQPWSAIDDASVWDGRFGVKLSGRMLKWCNVKLKHVPNAHVFLAAVDQFRTART